MKTRYPLVTLREVVAFQRGLTYGKSDEVDLSENVVLRANNIDLKTGKLNFSELRYIKDSVEVPASKKVVKNSLLICTASGSKSHLGKVALIDDDYGYAFGGFMGQITPTDKLDCKYLFYVLTSEDYRDFIDSLTDGANINNLKFDSLGAFPFPVPPIEEQRRIVAILDEAFAGIDKAIANTEKNIQNAREIFDSYLNNIFSNPGPDWEEKTLEEISINFGRGKSRHRPRNAPHLYGGKYPFVQTGDIRNADHIITEYSQTYSEDGLAQSKLWPKGTICITIAANIAETAILGFDACFPDSIIGVQPNPKEADVGFVEYLLQSFKVSIQAKGKGSAQDNINMGTFEHERFPFPTVAEQNQIVGRLDGLSEKNRRLDSVNRGKIVELDELKKSILQKAFVGEI